MSAAANPAELLAQHFDEAFSAQGGLQRLRELILTLAMQGKLVEQNPSEGRNIGEDSDSEGLPSSWRWVSLGDVVDVLDSLRKPVTKLDRREGPYPYYGASGIVDYVDQYIFDEPLVLVGEDGAKWGKGDRTAFRIEGKTWVNNHAHVLRPHREVLDDHYVIYCLIERDLQPFITGMTVPKLNQARLNSIPIPLPPLAEQRRIVARIDQLMARCDELEALRGQQEQKRVQVHRAVLREVTAAQDPAAFAQNWQFLADHFGELHATPKDLAELRGAILQLAVMGKLVPQDASEGTAAELLEQIQAEKKRLVQEGKIKAPKPLPSVTEAEQPYQVPEGWAWVRLGEITLVTSGITKGRNLTGRKLIEVPYLRVANVQRGYLNLEEMKNIELPVDELEKYRVIYGDLLITEGGDWDKVGRTAIWHDEIENCTHQNHVFKARKVVPNQNEDWLQMFLNSAISRNYFAGSAKQTTNLASINMTQLLACPVTLPPLAEQRRIVAKVDQLMGLCDVLQERLTAQGIKQGQLLGAVMAQLAPPTAVSRPAATAGGSRRGRPSAAAGEGSSGEKRGRGRPRKVVGAEPARSIPQASSEADAIRKLEALRLERAQGDKLVGLFEE